MLRDSGIEAGRCAAQRGEASWAGSACHRRGSVSKIWNAFETGGSLVAAAALHTGTTGAGQTPGVDGRACDANTNIHEIPIDAGVAESSVMSHITGTAGGTGKPSDAEGAGGAVGALQAVDADVAAGRAGERGGGGGVESS